MKAIKKIIEWSKELEDWESHTVRLLLEKGYISDDERKDILVNISPSASRENTPKPEMIRLKSGDIFGEEAAKKKLF